MPDNDLEAAEGSGPLREFPNITLRQLALFNEIMKSASQAEIADRYDDLSKSTLSKEITALKKDLNLTYIADKDFWQSPQAYSLRKAIRPLLAAYEKFSRFEHPRTVHVGAGGSLLGWLVGAKAEDIRNACSKLPHGAPGPIKDVSLFCQPLTNRDVIEQVGSGILEFGLVRKSLLKYSRLVQAETIRYLDLGSVTYGIAVPKKLKEAWLEWGTSWDLDEEGYLLFEDTILDSGHFASVGPEGEFKERLYRAIKDRRIELKVEFGYRSFPQIIPHLLAGTHFGLCPILKQWGASIPDTEIFPLKLLKEYRREIVLIWNEKLLKNWIDIEEIGRLLKWSD